MIVNNASEQERQLSVTVLWYEFKIPCKFINIRAWIKHQADENVITEVDVLKKNFPNLGPAYYGHVTKGLPCTLKYRATRFLFFQEDILC